MTNVSLLAIAGKLRQTDISDRRILVGYDGFRDRIMHVVDKRTGPDSYDRVRTLPDYGQKFIDAAGLSMNIEMVPIVTKLGGVATILANSLTTLGANMTYIGALGKHGIDPVFADFAARAARVISISDPATSDAVEFLDGKVISSQLEPLKDVNWENLLSYVSVEELAKIIDESDVIAFANWTLVIRVGTIWEGIANEVFPLLKNDKRRMMFFDLADPAKRTDHDLLDALHVIERYEKKFEVTLGLNEKEAYGVAERFGAKAEDFPDVTQLVTYLKERIAVSTIVVHPVKGAVASGPEGIFSVEGPYCPAPKLTTGAGDNFNAGFITGRLTGLDLEQSLRLGTANSGFYVRNARSAAFGELIEFVEQWGLGRPLD